MEITAKRWEIISAIYPHPLHLSLLCKQGMTLTISLSLLHADTTVVGLGLGLGGFWILGSINNWGKDEKRFDLGLQKR